MVEVSLPDPHDLGTWVPIRTFTSREEAIRFVQETFGGDDRGRICVISGADEEEVADEQFTAPLPDVERRDGPVPAAVVERNVYGVQVSVRDPNGRTIGEVHVEMKAGQVFVYVWNHADWEWGDDPTRVVAVGPAVLPEEEEEC